MADPQTLALQAQMNNPYWAIMQRVAAQSLPNSTFTRIQYDTIIGDPAGMCTIGASAQITLPVSGLWTINIVAGYSNAATTQAYVIGYNINGANVVLAQGDTAFNVGVSVPVSFTYPRLAGDVLYFAQQQNTGGALNTAFNCIVSVKLDRFL